MCLAQQLQHGQLPVPRYRSSSAPPGWWGKYKYIFQWKAALTHMNSLSFQSSKSQTHDRGMDETKGILCYQSAFSCGITMEIGKNSSCCHWTSSPTPCAKRLRASAASTWHSKCISWDWRRFGEIDRVGRWLDGDLMAWFDMVWYCLIWLLTKLYAKKPSNLFKFM